MSEECTFCKLAENTELPHFVYADNLTMAIMDLRQFHPGHVIVMPRQHFQDVRELDYTTGAALMYTVSLITRAVSAAFPNEGLSLWHSIGDAAYQEIPHLHIHIHPRKLDDGVLRIYPKKPYSPDWEVLSQYAQRVKAQISKENV